MPYNPLAVEAKFGKHQQIALGRLQCVVVTHMLPYTTNKVLVWSQQYLRIFTHNLPKYKSSTLENN